MNPTPITVTQAVLVEDQVQFTLIELCRATHADSELLIALVHEGVLTPVDEAGGEWRFAGTALRRARAAMRLSRDLELSAAGTALVIDLLDQIEALRSRLRQLGSH